MLHYFYFRKSEIHSHMMIPQEKPDEIQDIQKLAEHELKSKRLDKELVELKRRLRHVDQVPSDPPQHKKPPQWRMEGTSHIFSFVWKLLPFPAGCSIYDRYITGSGQFSSYNNQPEDGKTTFIIISTSQDLQSAMVVI